MFGSVAELFDFASRRGADQIEFSTFHVLSFVDVASRERMDGIWQSFLQQAKKVEGQYQNRRYEVSIVVYKQFNPIADARFVISE